MPGIKPDSVTSKVIQLVQDFRQWLSQQSSLMAQKPLSQGLGCLQTWLEICLHPSHHARLQVQHYSGYQNIQSIQDSNRPDFQKKSQNKNSTVWTHLILWNSQTPAMCFKIQNEHNTIINLNINFQSWILGIKDKLTVPIYRVHWSNALLRSSWIKLCQIQK